MNVEMYMRTLLDLSELLAIFATMFALVIGSPLFIAWLIHWGLS